ncbi:hypothetical protein PVAP13_4NG066200 [Panicum virgatum]|uniref:Uncharacterized protein n=1 Tax=Panicum virgatum TaxID=38727 RepID=A0A8T0T5A3_PANVG|nr:hypothetical protein PVAP13_4NG066200 [Panicum virgatum]
MLDDHTERDLPLSRAIINQSRQSLLIIVSPRRRRRPARALLQCYCHMPLQLQPTNGPNHCRRRRASFRVQASAASGHPGPAATFRPCGGAFAPGDAGGESRQRRSSRATAATRSSGDAAAFLGGARANATWRSSASAVVSVPSSRRISSPTASAQRPQTQRPRCSARTAAMYAGVHSSVNPQHSHLAFSTSMPPLLPIWRSFFSSPFLAAAAGAELSLCLLPLLLPDGVGRRDGRRRGAAAAAAAAAAALLARDARDDVGGG